MVDDQLASSRFNDVGFNLLGQRIDGRACVERRCRLERGRRCPVQILSWIHGAVLQSSCAVLNMYLLAEKHLYLDLVIDNYFIQQPI